MRNLWLLAGIVFIGGCTSVKTYTIEKPRIDTDIEGNRGYLAGTPKEEPKENRLGETRTVSVMEIELASPQDKKISRGATKEEKIKTEPAEISGF